MYIFLNWVLGKDSFPATPNPKNHEKFVILMNVSAFLDLK
jgi:hypothetical protein